MMKSKKNKHYSDRSNLSRRTNEYILCRSVFLLLLSTFLSIAVRGFSIIPTPTRMGLHTIPTTTSLLVDTSGTVWGDKHQTSLIQKTASACTTTMLFAGLFGEQTKAKNQNNTYVSSTSVSDTRIYCFPSLFETSSSQLLMLDYFILIPYLFFIFSLNLKFAVIS